jgi:hypothetical protein
VSGTGRKKLIIILLTTDQRSGSVLVACSPMQKGCGAPKTGVPSMCDYSLQSMMSRPAKVGDKLTTHNFRTGTRGFAAPESSTVAVCVRPGTELAFSSEIAVLKAGLLGWKSEKLGHTTAIFRQVNKDKPCTHHDALEFPNGQIVLLTELCEGQEATVLQLPVRPVTAVEAEAQKRVAYTG